MPRLTPIIGVKEKTKSSLTQNGWHVASLRNEFCDAKPASGIEYLKTLNYQLPALNYQLPTTNYQLSTINSYSSLSHFLELLAEHRTVEAVDRQDEIALRFISHNPRERRSWRIHEFAKMPVIWEYGYR